MPIVTTANRLQHELGPNRFTSLATPTLGSQDTSVWLVEIPPDAPSTPHQLLREEIFVVLEGEVQVTLGDAVSQATVGDTIIVPINTQFQLRNSGSQPFKALCCLPVGGQAKIGDGEPFTPPWAL